MPDKTTPTGELRWLLTDGGPMPVQQWVSPTGETVWRPVDNAPRVLNKRRDVVPDGAVYIGRPSKWGNPFQIGRHGSRAEVIARHRKWLCDQPDLMASLHELRGRDLVCWCAPAPCHGDTLKELANA